MCECVWVSERWCLCVCVCACVDNCMYTIAPNCHCWAAAVVFSGLMAVALARYRKRLALSVRFGSCKAKGKFSIVFPLPSIHTWKEHIQHSTAQHNTPHTIFIYSFVYAIYRCRRYMKMKCFSGLDAHTLSMTEEPRPGCEDACHGKNQVLKLPARAHAF